MRKRTHGNPNIHAEWLSQVDVDGPFLAYPVLKDMWPNGVDRLGDSDDRLLIFRQSFVQWQRAFDSYVEQPKTPESKAAYDPVRRAWIDVVLDDIAEWASLRSDADVTVRSPGEQITVTASGMLQGRDADPAALLLICEPTSGLRDAGLDGWAANDIDRLAMLLRKAQVEVGIVTDGQWWAVVWAKEGKPTGSGMVNALTWAEEPLLRTPSSPSSISAASAPPTQNSACPASSSAANSRQRRSPRRLAPRSDAPSSYSSRRSPKPGSRPPRRAIQTL